ncbi:magnesium transporter [Candidatus Peribacteria bacterium]|nr:magnesium transporter [Candidatus Peribacteria bacterium]
MQFTTLVHQADRLLSQKDDMRLRNFLLNRTPQELARLINHLPHGKRKTFVMLPPEMQADIFPRLNEEGRGYILPKLSDHVIARFIHFNDEDDAADIMQLLPEKRRGSVMQYVRPEKRVKIEKLLTFDPETAGGLMDLNFITVPVNASLKEVSERVQQHRESQRHTPMLVVMEHGMARGFIPHKTLFLAKPSATAGTLMHRLPMMPHTIDQEKILRIAARERGDVFGVTDDKDQFLGIIHLRDLLQVAQSEATEDVYKFAGVSPEEEMLGSPWAAIRMRSSWLVINLATAFLASFVVSLFQGTIAKFAILAVYMPIVAGMGGNAGTQTLAVAVRGLALSDITPHQKMTLIIKEIITGAANGVINGIIVAAVVLMLGQPPALAAVLGIAMVFNLVIAGIFGAVIPLLLKSFRIDPAVASTVFVTTATDCFGFLVFLGLAAAFME